MQSPPSPKGLGRTGPRGEIDGMVGAWGRGRARSAFPGAVRAGLAAASPLPLKACGRSLRPDQPLGVGAAGAAGGTCLPDLYDFMAYHQGLASQKLYSWILLINFKLSHIRLSKPVKA